jgi:hypothetical protein
MIVAIMPFAIWMVPTTDVIWFCEQDYEEISIHFGVGTETPDEYWYVPYVLKGKEYVKNADETLRRRDLIMCTETCPCLVDNWDLWSKDPGFSTEYLVIDSENGVDDWEDC